jgi:hypothetical protein
MALSGSSSSATANNASNQAMQINGDVGGRHEIRCDTVFIQGGIGLGPPLASSEQQTEPPPSYSFFFGPIPTPDDERDGVWSPSPITTSPPTITHQQLESIKNMDTAISNEYKRLHQDMTAVKASCVVKLREKMKLQEASIRLHIKAMERWPTSKPGNLQRTDNKFGPGIFLKDAWTTEVINDCELKLRTIADKVGKAATKVPNLIGFSKVRPSTSFVF